MKLGARSAMTDVAASVADALAKAGIRAVLTGGACATLYSEGEYQSSDLDFILQSATKLQDLDDAMASADFRRSGNYYEHPRAPFLVEFPAGPLGIGADLDVRPVTLRLGRVRVKVLSATDSCRDRLAAFYHWNDRQSLAVAVEIGLRRRLNTEAIRRWSAQEKASRKFSEFLAILGRERKMRRDATPRDRRTRASRRSGGRK
jgi:hypothetical protein